MLQLFPEYAEQIRDQAIELFPEEAVWLITKAGCYLVDNIAEDRENFFDVSTKDIRTARKEGLLAVVHSHCNGKEYPSSEDMQAQINNAVPFGLVTTDGVGASKVCWWGSKDPKQVEHLTNRTFRHGVTDCFALVKDFFLVTYGIDTGDLARNWEWWETDPNFMIEGAAKLGFSKVKGEPKPGDVWLSSHGSRDGTLVHCGVLLENGLTHHHPGTGQPYSSSRKAVVTPIYPYLRSITTWMRHKDLA